jgi:hypothetical protein
MGRAKRGRKKAKTEGISPLRFLRQNAGAFLEHGKSPSFFHLNQHVTSEGLMCYKRSFAVDSSSVHLFSKACPLFLTGEAREGVRFVMR